MKKNRIPAACALLLAVAAGTVVWLWGDSMGEAAAALLWAVLTAASIAFFAHLFALVQPGGRLQKNSYRALRRGYLTKRRAEVSVPDGACRVRVLYACGGGPLRAFSYYLWHTEGSLLFFPLLVRPEQYGSCEPQLRGIEFYRVTALPLREVEAFVEYRGSRAPRRRSRHGRRRTAFAGRAAMLKTQACGELWLSPEALPVLRKAAPEKERPPC